MHRTSITCIILYVFFLIIIIIIIFLFQFISFTAVEQYLEPKKENKMSWFKTMITFRRRYYNLKYFIFAGWLILGVTTHVVPPSQLMLFC